MGSWNAMWEKKKGIEMCPHGYHQRQEHPQTHRLRLLATVQAEEEHRGELLAHVAHRVSGATRWWVVSVVRPPHPPLFQVLRSSARVTLMSLVARSNMRWVQHPLWDSLVQLLSTTVFFFVFFFGLYTYAHKHTYAGNHRQKSSTQNKGIIIPCRDKWSSHFPARFRSLIQTRHNGWHLGEEVVYSKLDTFFANFLVLQSGFFSPHFSFSFFFLCLLLWKTYISWILPLLLGGKSASKYLLLLLQH